MGKFTEWLKDNTIGKRCKECNKGRYSEINCYSYHTCSYCGHQQKIRNI